VKKGLYGKYRISKDGESTDPDARYFVLRYDTDPHARVAMVAYAESVERDNPQLARDLKRAAEAWVHNVVWATCTCGACPSQWEGADDEGRHVYARYRWGSLSVKIGGKEVFQAEYGDSMSGVMSYDELKRLTAGHVIWPEYECEGGE
jgi:hypothetical protein